MFRKIVSNIAFSPALVGQLGFYAKRLRKEEATRRIGLIFTALALVVQSFAVFSPPESANAANPSNFVHGGISSVNDYLKYYDNNTNNIKDIYTSVGITRAEIAAAKKGTFNSKSVRSWGLTSRFSAKQGEKKYEFQKSNGQTGTVYHRPLSLWDGGQFIKTGSTYDGFIGQSKKFGWFAVDKNCGNLITKKTPPPAPKPAAACRDLAIKKITRTKFSFSASATISNGAKVQSYTYTVKDSAGKTVHTKKIATSSTSSSYTYDQSKIGRYTVTLTVVTSLGNKTSSGCNDSFTVAPLPTVPTAVCDGVKATISSRTIVDLSGDAVTSGGATVSKYTFTIKDSSGKTVATREVASSSLSAAADDVRLTKAGKYSVELAVTTSLGVKKDSRNCVASFTIAPPAVCPLNPSLPEASPDCQPCPGDENIWIKDADCEAVIIETKTVANISQDNRNATELTAKASDRIAYTINIENTGLAPTTAQLQEKLDDVLEYATLIDNGGGSFDKTTRVLSWPDVTLTPGQKQSRTFVVQLAGTIPAVATGSSDRTSYNCVMTNTFGNSVDIKVDCPAPKQVEQVVEQLPHTGTTENIIFAGGVLAVVAFFYARARQVKKEVRLIRRDVNAGTI